MNFRRIWPLRYCPSCGGSMLRAGAAMRGRGLFTLLIAVSSELAAWLGIGAAVFVAHRAGIGLGVFVGCVLLLGTFFALMRLDNVSRRCECAKCHKRFRFGQCLQTGNSAHSEE